jgi:hypothetical protein
MAIGLYVSNGLQYNICWTVGQNALTKGTLIDHDHTDVWGTKYGYAYDSGRRGFYSCHWDGLRSLASYNRYYYGSAYAHKQGSKYTLRETAYITHKYGIKRLYAGDKVGINSNQGYAASSQSGKIRVDGYYNAGSGTFHPTTGGWLVISRRRHPDNMQLNTK